jgi:hypothetical protein
MTSNSWKTASLKELKAFSVEKVEPKSNVSSSQNQKLPHVIQVESPSSSFHALTSLSKPLPELKANMNVNVELSCLWHKSYVDRNLTGKKGIGTSTEKEDARKKEAAEEEEKKKKKQKEEEKQRKEKKQGEEKKK